MSQRKKMVGQLIQALKTSEIGAWLLLSDFENRTFAGNDGYSDEVNHLYRWDSTVPNHQAIKSGDISIIWNKRQLIGISRIESIEIDLNTKNRYRCPVCGSTKIKKRVTKHPEYACGNLPCRAEFEIPTTEEVGITTYVAEYGQMWVPLVGELDASQCRQLAKSKKSQHSMRVADKARLISFLETIN